MPGRKKPISAAAKKLQKEREREKEKARHAAAGDEYDIWRPAEDVARDKAAKIAGGGSSAATAAAKVVPVAAPGRNSSNTTGGGRAAAAGAGAGAGAHRKAPTKAKAKADDAAAADDDGSGSSSGAEDEDDSGAGDSDAAAAGAAAEATGAAGAAGTGAVEVKSGAAPTDPKLLEVLNAKGAHALKKKAEGVAPGKKLYYDPDKLKTVFVKETDEEVERAKLDAQKPFARVRRDVWMGGGAVSGVGEVIGMPLRPKWLRGWTKQQLEQNEESYFRTYLVDVYSKYTRARLNHFEHNLEVWRQLWRVCERSDILLLLVDIRHPLFHFPPSLYDYVVHTLHKPLLLVLNKIDLVSRDVVNRWTSWFARHYPHVRVIPFTSHPLEGTVTDESGTAASATITGGGGAVGAAATGELKKKRRKTEGGGIRPRSNPWGAEALLKACHALVVEHAALRAHVAAAAASAAGPAGAANSGTYAAAAASNAVAALTISFTSQHAPDRGELKDAAPAAAAAADAASDAKQQQPQQLGSGVEGNRAPAPTAAKPTGDSGSGNKPKKPAVLDIEAELARARASDTVARERAAPKKDKRLDAATRAARRQERRDARKAGPRGRALARAGAAAAAARGAPVAGRGSGRAARSGAKPKTANDDDDDGDEDEDESESGAGGDEGAADGKKVAAAATAAAPKVSAKRGSAANSDDDTSDDDESVAPDAAEAVTQLEDDDDEEGRPAADDNDGATALLKRPPPPYITLGTIGHPNAGKSTLVNALAGKKLVSVSKTPGHTKHLQTLFLNKTTRLCDCPGLVFPSADMPKALQVLSGLYPIAQCRDPYSAIQFLAERVPVERIYKLVPVPIAEARHARMLAEQKHSAAGGAADDDDDDGDTKPSTEDDDDSDGNQKRRRNRKPKPTPKAPVSSKSGSSKAVNTHNADHAAWLRTRELQAAKDADEEAHFRWSAWSICEAYAYKKGYRTRKGALDCYRAANEMLRDAEHGTVVLNFDPPVVAAGAGAATGAGARAEGAPPAAAGAGAGAAAPATAAN